VCFNTLETWKDYQQFGDYAQPVILPRTADTQKIHTGIFFSKTPLVDISSTSNTNFVLNAEVYLVRFFYYLLTAFLNS
jgi:nicotinic acid mononucleotide adenylyltransferase